jgi:undecaprenyl-diphosphatase
LLKPLREFASDPHYLGICLVVTSMILFAGQKQRFRPAASTHKIRDVLWIGAMQSAALIPGISRSASTISCATMLGWKAREAVRFSFLLSIPTILGGNCLELLKIYASHQTPPTLPLTSCLIGLLTSFGSGLLVIRFALSFLEKGNLRPFAWYCLACGTFVTILLNFH